MGTLYESIKELCIENGIKPSKMCVDLEMSKSMMTKLKNGTKKNIETGTAQKIADYFGVSVDRVLGSEQKEKSPAPEGAERIPGYSDLSEENKVKAREYIALLLGSQQKG